MCDATAGLFSSEEGANDFVSWLQNESGYTAEQKKTVLQRVAELFQRIVDRIKELIGEGNLSEIAADFAEAQADEAARLRQMFLDVLDGMNVEEETSGENKFSKKGLTQNGKTRYNKNRYTDEFTSIGMQWAYNPGTEIGEVKRVFNGKIGAFQYMRATKNGVGFKVLKDGISSNEVISEREDIRYASDGETTRAEIYAESADSSWRDRGRGRGNGVVPLENGRAAGTTDAVYGETSGSRNAGDRKGDVGNNRGDLGGTGPELNEKYSLPLNNEYTVNEDGLVEIGRIFTFGLENRRQIVQRLMGTSQFFKGKPFYEAMEDCRYAELNGLVKRGDNYLVVYHDANLEGVESEHQTKAEQMNKLRLSLGLEAQNRSLLQQNEQLRELNRRQGAQIREMQKTLTMSGVETFADSRKVEQFASRIQRDYKTPRGVGQREEIARQLEDLYHDMANNVLSRDVTQTRAEELAERILKESDYNQPQVSEYSQAVIDDVKSVGVQPSDAQKAEAAYRYGSYGAFYRASMGTMKLRNDGMPLDMKERTPVR